MAIDANLRVKTHAESSHSAGPAEAGTHDKHMQDLHFLAAIESRLRGKAGLVSVPRLFTLRVKRLHPAARSFAGRFRNRANLNCRFQVQLGIQSPGLAGHRSPTAQRHNAETETAPEGAAPDDQMGTGYFRGSKPAPTW
jgi:hypothetical protein